VGILECKLHLIIIIAHETYVLSRQICIAVVSDDALHQVMWYSTCALPLLLFFLLLNRPIAISRLQFIDFDEIWYAEANLDFKYVYLTNKIVLQFKMAVRCHVKNRFPSTLCPRKK